LPGFSVVPVNADQVVIPATEPIIPTTRVDSSSLLRTVLPINRERDMFEDLLARGDGVACAPSALTRSA
jgi:hypothetical protein